MRYHFREEHESVVHGVAAYGPHGEGTWCGRPYSTYYFRRVSKALSVNCLLCVGKAR